MRVRIVNGKEITSRSLRAEDYVGPSSKRIAKTLLDDWVRVHSVLNRKSVAIRDLEAKIVIALDLCRKP